MINDRTQAEILETIRRVVRRDLADIEQHIRTDRKAQALTGLGDAVLRLSSVINQLER